MSRVLALAAMVMAVTATAAGAEEWRVSSNVRITGVEGLTALADGTVLLHQPRQVMRLDLRGGGVKLSGYSAPPEEGPPDMIPGGRVAEGSKGIARAWLSRPTDRYRHGVLGDAIEAAALAVETEGGQVLRHVLGEDSVFEDLEPRLADLDGDGRDEVVVVRSYLDRGAALAVFGVRDGTLQPIAESPPLGQANRWLSPLAIADFDGDKRPEIAVIETPHVGGRLVMWRLEDGKLVEAGSTQGYTGHIQGSTETSLAAVADVNGDGVPDLILPAQDRMSVDALSFAGGRFAVLASAALPSRLRTRIGAVDLDGSGREDLVWVLEDGTVQVVRR